MDHEGAVQLESWSVSHQFPSAKDDDVVCQDGKATLLQRRHGGLSGLEIKVLRRIAHDGREGLVEDGP